MLRKLSASITAFSLLLATALPAGAADWPSMYRPAGDLMAGVLNPNEMVGMAYLRIPFGGPPHAHNNEARFGLSLAKPLPEEFQSYGGSNYMMSLVDLQLSPGGGVEDLRVSGLSARETYWRFNARSEGEPSGYWTYGLMAAALGLVAVLVVTSKSDGFSSADQVPGSSSGTGSTTGTTTSSTGN